MLPFTPITSNSFKQLAESLTTNHLSESLTLALRVLKSDSDNGFHKLWYKQNGPKLLWPLKRYVEHLHEELLQRQAKDKKIFDGVMKRLRKDNSNHPAFEEFNKLYKGPSSGRYPTWPSSVINTHYDYLAINFPQYYPLKERRYVVGMYPPVFVSPSNRNNSLSFFKE